MISSSDLLNYSEAAERFGVDHATIRNLVRKWNLTPKRPHGVPGKYNGLNNDDLKIIERALNMSPQLSV